MPFKVSVDVPKHFHLFTHLLQPCQPWIIQVRKHRKSTADTTSLPLVQYSNRLWLKHLPLQTTALMWTTTTAYFSLLSVSFQEAPALFWRLSDTNELHEPCCLVTEQHFPSRRKDMCNSKCHLSISPMCCRVTLPQNTFGYRRFRSWENHLNVCLNDTGSNHTLSRKGTYSISTNTHNSCHKIVFEIYIQLKNNF